MSQIVRSGGGLVLLHAASTHVEDAPDEILVEDVGTAGVVGTVPTSDGLGGLVMLPSGGGGPHDSSHDENAGDEILVEDLGTASTESRYF